MACLAAAKLRQPLSAGGVPQDNIPVGMRRGQLPAIGWTIGDVNDRAEALVIDRQAVPRTDLFQEFVRKDRLCGRRDSDEGDRHRDGFARSGLAGTGYDRHGIGIGRVPHANEIVGAGRRQARPVGVEVDAVKGLVSLFEPGRNPGGEQRLTERLLPGLRLLFRGEDE